MDARPVVAWTSAGLVVVLAGSNPTYRALALAVAVAVIAAAVGLGRARRLLASASALGLSAVVLTFAVSHVGATVLFALPDAVPAVGGPYTVEALVYGLVTGITLSAAVLVVAPVSLLLEPHEVVDALPGLLARSGTALAAALNLVPGIVRSFTAVVEAQRLRGWRPRGPTSWAEIVVPVVLTAIEDSIQLAEAMEARAFGSGPRTRLRRLRLGATDWLVLAAAGVALAGFVAARVAGWTGDWYPYPSLTWPEVSPLPVAACLLLAVPVLVWRRPPSAA